MWGSEEAQRDTIFPRCFRHCSIPNLSLCLQQEQDGTNFQVPPGVPEPISKCGDLDVIFEYRAASQKLTVTIVRAQGLPDKDRSGVNSWQVHVVLLPNKKQRGRTSIQRGPNPSFKEKVTFAKVEPRDVAASAVRFRLYAARKMTRERMMGERLFYLSHLHQDGEMKVTLVLEPRSNISVSMLNGAANDVLCWRIWNCQPLM